MSYPLLYLLGIIVTVIVPMVAVAQADMPTAAKEPLLQFLEQTAKRYKSERMQSMDSGISFSEFRVDWSRELDSISSVVRQTEDRMVLQVSLFAWLRLVSLRPTTFDTTMMEEALGAIPPTSSLWELPLGRTPAPMGLVFSCNCRDRIRTYFQSVADHHPSDIVRTQVLYDLIEDAYWTQDMVGVEHYRALLTERFPAAELTKMAHKDFPVNAKVVIGRPAPDFLVRDLYDASRSYSNASFRGKYYLIDFWFTSCKPCVAEMPFLHEAYERFKDKELEIVSIGIEGVNEKVEQFRKKWPMPWLHVGNLAETSLTGAFEVVYYPRTILVDPNGVIIAMDEQLRGKKLVQTLEKFLGVSGEEDKN